MAIKTLDPRMIDPNYTLKINTINTSSLSASNTKVTNSELTNIQSTNVQSTNIDTTSLDSVTLSGITLIASDTVFTNITATNNVVSNFLILTADNNITFSNADNSKTYHINTTVTPLLTAVFPETISNGFNVSIINTGIGAIELSANPPLNAIGLVNSKQYTGVLVYKQNDQFYGIGVLE